VSKLGRRLLTGSDDLAGKGTPTSESDYRHLVEQQGRVLQVGSDGDQRISLFDQVTKDWTKPLSQSAAMQTYIRKVAIICSACNYVTSFDGGVENHLRQMRTAAEYHEGAELVDLQDNSRPGAKKCTGCDGVFSARKQQARKHLDAILSAPAKHRDVKRIKLLQYTLGASEPVVLEEVHLNGDGPKHLPTEGPEVRRVERRGRRRRRKRNRSRS